MIDKACQGCSKPLTGKQYKFCAECAKQAQKHRERRAHYKARGHTEEQWQNWEQQREQEKRSKEARESFVEKPNKLLLFSGDPDREQKITEWQHKYQRVKQRRLRGKIVCFWCEEVIPEETLKKRKRAKDDPPRCCCREHSVALRTYLGEYVTLSRYGNRSQQEKRFLSGPSEKRQKHMRAVNETRKQGKEDDFLSFLMESETD